MSPRSNPFASVGNRHAADALFDAIKTARCSALIGAGLSIAAGYPSWDELLRTFDDAVRRSGGYYDSAIAWLSESQDPLWRAQELRRQMGEDRYFALLRETFRPKRTLNGTPMVDRVVGLPFKHYLTTNFDCLLEEALLRKTQLMPTVVDWSNDSDVSEFLFRLQDPQYDSCVVHLHGRYNDPANIILTDRDYTNRYQVTNSIAQKLISIFATQTVVFVGFSLNDPALNHILRQTKLALGAGSIRHFAILGLTTWNDTSESMARYRFVSLYGIEPVFYPVEGDHEQLGNILQFLNGPDKVGGWVPSGGPDDVGPPAPGAAMIPPPVSPSSDPQKGRWGGKDMDNGLQLTATVTGDRKATEEIKSISPSPTESPTWFDLRIEVKPVTGLNRTLRGRVRFHLHPTFVPDVQDVQSRDNRAVLKLRAWGAFTVGIEVFDEPYTRLELDLADPAKVTSPPDFRCR